MLSDIYRKKSILSAKKQKLVAKKLEKETSKTYNIKALQQCNCNLGLNFKANTPASKLVKSLKLILGEETNFTHLFSNVT